MASAQADQWRRLAGTFRRTFNFPITARQDWFPGHMVKGMRQMQRSVGMADCIIEVHDARIPLSGRNKNFRYRLAGNLPHILVLNKEDLVDNSEKVRIKKLLRKTDKYLSDVIFTNCKQRNNFGLSKVIPRAIDLIQSSDRYHRTANPESNILVVGIPNVGKSSLINVLREKNLQITGKASPVGDKPGVTRAVMTSIRVSNNPLVYLVDTPGIMVPNISDMHVGLKLALCSTLHDHLVGEEYMADYLLFHLNQTAQFDYVSYMKLDEPMDDARLMLAMTALYQGMVKQARDMDTGQMKKFPDLKRAAQYFIRAFRSQQLGRINLDSKILDSVEMFGPRALQPQA